MDLWLIKYSVPVHIQFQYFVKYNFSLYRHQNSMHLQHYTCCQSLWSSMHETLSFSLYIYIYTVVHETNFNILYKIIFYRPVYYINMVFLINETKLFKKFNNNQSVIAKTCKNVVLFSRSVGVVASVKLFKPRKQRPTQGSINTYYKFYVLKLICI